jgi:hypothetical protein
MDSHMKGSKVLCFRWHPLPIPAAALALTQGSSIASHLLRPHMATLPIWHGQHDGFATRERKPLCFLAFCSACYKASAWLVIVQATVAGRAVVRVKQRLTIFFGAVACASFGISRKHSRHLKMIVLADSNIMTKFKFI